jgi:hypothetical protein
MAPAEVPEIASILIHGSSSSRSSTPPGECAVRAAALQGEVDKNRSARRYRRFVDRRAHLTNSGIDMDFADFPRRARIT